VPATKGGSFAYSSDGDTGTLSIGGTIYRRTYSFYMATLSVLSTGQKEVLF
jgi:hypothetical protein